MKLLVPAALLVFLAGCASQAPYVRSHWSERSLAPRISRAFLSYDPEMDGSYRDFQWRKKRDINMTLSRHFLNRNPENPFQEPMPEFYEPRPTHSIVPRPWNYIHLEGIALGAIAYASGGAFIVLPLDSVIGTLEEGGTEEFMEGGRQFFRPLGVTTATFMHDTLGFRGRETSSTTDDTQ